MESFTEAVKTTTFSQRIGRSFPIGKKSQHNIAFWGGAMRVRLDSNTSGSLRLDDALSDDVWDRKDEIVSDYWNWYDDLGQFDPRKAIADNVLTPIMNKIDELDGSGIVHYNLDKKPKGEWNMLVGSQFEFNKNWQVRAELGILGDRSSVLLSTNYRFGIKRGNKTPNK